MAEVAGKPITLKDVDAKWEEFDAAERARIVAGDVPEPPQHARPAGRRHADRERREGRGPVRRRRSSPRTARSACRAVTEADVAQFYEQNKDRAQGRTLDQLRGEIKPYLEERRAQQARAMLVDELKSEERRAT